LGRGYCWGRWVTTTGARPPLTEGTEPTEVYTGPGESDARSSETPTGETDIYTGGGEEGAGTSFCPSCEASLSEYSAAAFCPDCGDEL
jgi:hypothetical protein